MRVFTVGGSRGNAPGYNYNRYDGPRGRSQWSNRGAWSQPKAGPTQYSDRVDGSYSTRTDNRTHVRSGGKSRLQEGARRQD